MKRTLMDSGNASGLVDDQSQAPRVRELRTYTPLQVHFLSRLQELEQIRIQMDESPTQDPFTVKLVGRGLFATYHECIDQGVAEEARQILNM